MFCHVVPISTLGYFLNPTATLNSSQCFLPTKRRDKLHHPSGIQTNRSAESVVKIILTKQSTNF
jgi:hypothetical protein